MVNMLRFDHSQDYILHIEEIPEEPALAHSPPASNTLPFRTAGRKLLLHLADKGIAGTYKSPDGAA